MLITKPEEDETNPINHRLITLLEIYGKKKKKNDTVQ